jgi:hypothetical protein
VAEYVTAVIGGNCSAADLPGCRTLFYAGAADAGCRWSQADRRSLNLRGRIVTVVDMRAPSRPLPKNDDGKPTMAVGC